jgi:fructokinase
MSHGLVEAHPFFVTSAAHLLAGVELGGTKCICILGTEPGEIRARERVVTSDPATTLAGIETILDTWSARYGRIAALGVATFGPLDLRPASPSYGYITETVKTGWSNTDVASRLAKRFSVPIGFDTDVNGAALAERRWGAAQGLDDFAYITVGTGVGVGLIVNGRPVHGSNHSELGHMRPVRLPGDAWPGICSFHGACVEGLACGPAIQARAGVPPDQLAPDHPVWDSVAHALGQLLHTLVLATAPRRILLGGGVMNAQQHLFVRIRRNLQQSLNGYVQLDEVRAGIDRYVVPPGLGPASGPMGALTLAANAFAGG